MLTMSQKLQLAETKIRFAEQAGRDENSVSSLVSQVEFDELQREFDALKDKNATLEEEFSARSAMLQHTTNELANALQAKQELERAKVRLDAKVTMLHTFMRIFIHQLQSTSFLSEYCNSNDIHCR